jgi:hypothetical protein
MEKGLGKKTTMQSMMQRALDAQSAAEIEKAKKTPPKVIPMTKEDREVLNSPEFKKASESTKDMKKGGMVKSSASKRADGIAVKGKTRGKIC